MKIRRVQFDINYLHILTFREEYKKAIAPFFGLEGLKYAIDNEGTQNESFRYILPNENIIILLRKEGISLVYEGDADDLKKQNGVMKIFWDIFELVKNISTYKRGATINITVHAVDLLQKEEYEDILKKPSYLRLNPFGTLDDFKCQYNFKKDLKTCRFEFGAFSEKDITTFQLRPFNSEFTEDLEDGLGLMCIAFISSPEKDPSFNKFKALLNEVEKLITSFKYKT